MFVGVISDTHDDMDRLRAAVDFFNAKGMGHVLHAGDLISPFTFEVLCGLKSPLSAVFGNNDGDRLLLREKSGGTVHVQPLMVELGGRRIVVVHEPSSVEALAKSGEFDVVIYGHTHTPEARTVGKTLVINPGKAARLHKGESTLAVLNTEKLEAQIISAF
jgi:putative phosphoesterase